MTHWQDTLPTPHGKWVAWNRDQTAIIASGDTFEEVKQAAALAGERSVLLAKLPQLNAFRHAGQHALYIVAVFISQVA